MQSNLVDTCHLCQKTMQKVISLSPGPIGDVFKDSRQEAAEVELCLYDLLLCPKCHNVQISIDPTKNIYKDYIYVSSSSVDLKSHYEKLSHDLLKQIKKDHVFIVEFGCNEGLLLELIKKELMQTSHRGGVAEKWKLLGIDPSKRAAQMAELKGIPTINDYFDLNLAKKVSMGYGKADLIIANFVMANISDMHSVALGVDELLNKDGIFVFETGYIVDILQFNLIDTIYPEHLSYYSLSALLPYFQKFKLRIFRAQNSSAKGGALRLWVCKNEADIKTEKSVQNVLDIENKLFANKNIFNDFLNRIVKFKAEIKSLAKEIKSKEKLCIYGASIGCIVMTEQFDVACIMDYFIDDNELKIGKFSPHRAIEVKSCEFLLQKGIKNVINFAWRFCDQIREKNMKFLNNGGVIYNVNLRNLKINEVRE